MKRNYNEKSFTPEEIEQGLFDDLIRYLLDYNKKSKQDYYDIHITSDGYCTIVEWVDVMYNNEYGEDGKFIFVDYDQVVMIEKTFPDNHVERVLSEEEGNERLQEWLEQNPGWVKNEFDDWVYVNNKEKQIMRYRDTKTIKNGTMTIVYGESLPNKDLVSKIGRTVYDIYFGDDYYKKFPAKGIAKLANNDTYDEIIGVKIASRKAKLYASRKQLKAYDNIRLKLLKLTSAIFDEEKSIQSSIHDLEKELKEINNGQRCL